jgi:hypothetical protein
MHDAQMNKSHRLFLKLFPYAVIAILLAVNAAIFSYLFFASL